MKEKKRKKTRIVRWILLPVLGYLTVTLILTVTSLLEMVVQNSRARNIDLGKQAFTLATQEGCGQSFKIYSEEEIAANANLQQVTLYKMSPQTSHKTDFVLILPGGGYMECDIYKVAMPMAAQVVAEGHTAFVLAYRYGKYCEKYSPLDDLAKAITFISQNADELCVNVEGYALAGFSAGGNAAGLFCGKELGYLHYNLPKPKTVILAYAWVNPDNNSITGNVWRDLAMNFSELIVNHCVLNSAFAGRDERQTLNVLNCVDSDFPATYLVSGDNDFVVHHQRNTMALSEALEKSDVRHTTQIGHGLNHGFGIGQGTVLENWVHHAIAFWQNNG